MRHDDVAGRDAEVEQGRREAVGGAVEPRVGDPLLAVDVRLARPGARAAAIRSSSAVFRAVGTDRH